MTEDSAAECTRLVTDRAGGHFDRRSTFSTAIAGRDAPEQRSGRVVLCDAAWRDHSSAQARSKREWSQRAKKKKRDLFSNPDQNDLTSARMEGRARKGKAWSIVKICLNGYPGEKNSRF